MINSGRNLGYKDEEGNQHFRYQRSCAVGEVIVSVFIFLDLHIVHLNKLKKVPIYNFTSIFHVQHLKKQQQQHHNTRTY